MERTPFDYEQELFQKWINSEEYKQRAALRLQIHSACNASPEARMLTEKLCKEDPLFFIENFGWTFDPRPQHAPNHLPFILFDYQKEVVLWLVKHIREGQDGLIEKSRDMGVTWLVIWTYYWFWLFEDSFSGLIGSYKEALVDNRTIDSMFGMLDYCVQNTPKWLIPARFKYKDNRQKLKLINPEKLNLVTGDTMNPDFSRGSRKNVVFLDEGASWEYFKDAWEAAGDTTPCRITCSTPKGHNQFAVLKESGIDILTVHWKNHPLKDDTWYEYQRVRRTDEEVAQELDISYQRSQTGRVYPEWDSVKWGEFPYDDSKPLYVSWDFGQTDDTAMIWWQEDEEGPILLDAYSNRGKTIDFYVPLVTGVISSDDIRYSKKDVQVVEEHANWKRGIHFGDPAGRFTNQVVNQSVFDVLKSYGIHVSFREEAKDFQTRKTETKLLLKNLRVNENPRTKELSIAIENASYPQVRVGGAEEVRSIKPIHNWTSHFRSAVEYFAVNYGHLRGRRLRVYDKFPIKEKKRIVAY